MYDEFFVEYIRHHHTQSMIQLYQRVNEEKLRKTLETFYDTNFPPKQKK